MPIELHTVYSPYRELTRPIMQFIDELDEQHQDDIITVVIPEFVTSWKTQWLHNGSAFALKAKLLYRPHTAVVSVPIHTMGDQTEEQWGAGDVGVPSMHVIVVGCGRVGSEVALNLVGSDGARRHRHRSQARGVPSPRRRLHGHHHGRRRLRPRHPHRGRHHPDCAVAAVTSGDNSNILIARVARETFGVARVVARIYDPRRASIYERLGIATVASVAWTSARVLRHLLGTDSTPDWIDPSAEFTIVERRVPAAAAGMSVANLEAAAQAAWPCSAASATASIPPAGHPAAGGRRRARRRRGRSVRDCSTMRCIHRGDALMKVIIAGAGSVGRYMAGQLQSSGHEVTLIDSDPTVVAQGKATRTPVGVNWMLGDACEVPTLTSAGAADADVVAAVTGDDEDNLVVSLLSKQEFAVPRVRRPGEQPEERVDVQRACGVWTCPSRRRTSSPRLVEEAVTVGSFVRLLSLEGGKARLAEVTLAQGLTRDRQGAHRAGSAPRVDRRRGAARRTRRRASR